MRRTQVQLNETTYELAKQRAFAENKSMAAVIRDAVEQYLTSSDSRLEGLESFGFIGSGRSMPGGPQPLSERHDEALAEDFSR